MDTFQTRTKLILNFVGNKYHYATPLKTFTPFTSKYITFMAMSKLKTLEKEKKIKVKRDNNNNNNNNNFQNSKDPIGVQKLH
jgi:hypothetical protein